MTVDGNSGDDASSTSQSAEAVNLSMRLSHNLAFNEEEEVGGGGGASSSKLQSSPQSPSSSDQPAGVGACALQNGLAVVDAGGGAKIAPAAAVAPNQNSDLSNSSRGGSLHNIRRTLSRWLRIQRPKANSESNSNNSDKMAVKPARRRLIGWPPRWSTGRSMSCGDNHSGENPCSHRALPPVPASSSFGAAAGVHPDGEGGPPERVRTPEMRPEDFPPGVAYLPPDDNDDEEEPTFEPSSDGIIDFAASIETVKNCDWYWGPICGSAAEQVLMDEPDGSFLVRDSSDDRYIFSLTFKLSGTVRHVRIEHDQGNFSFGSFTRFKSNTIVDFVENAVEHSRSGRYLFFLNRRPTNGPMRVQLLHPVSRARRVQSLQHMCRFVILKMVPRDHVDQLPVPKRIKEYLKTPNYYSEKLEDVVENDNDNDNDKDNLPQDEPVPEQQEQRHNEETNYEAPAPSSNPQQSTDF